MGWGRNRRKETLEMTDDLDIITEAPDSLAEAGDDSLDTQPDGDRQLITDSDAIDEGNTNDSDLGAEVAGDIGPKHG